MKNTLFTVETMARTLSTPAPAGVVGHRQGERHGHAAGRTTLPFAH